jgi:hypothetical protein
MLPLITLSGLMGFARLVSELVSPCHNLQVADHGVMFSIWIGLAGGA